MRIYRVTLYFNTEFVLKYGSSTLKLDVLAKNEESAVLKSERCLPSSCLRMIEGSVAYERFKSC